MAQKEDSELPKKRATVTSLDKKIDDLVEVIDIMSTNVRAIKAALESIADAIKKTDDDPPAEFTPADDRMYI